MLNISKLLFSLIEARVSTAAFSAVPVSKASITSTTAAKVASIANAALLETAASKTTAAATTTIAGASAAAVVARVPGQIFQSGIYFLQGNEKINL